MQYEKGKIIHINPEVYEKKLDGFGDIHIPNCEPKQLRTVTERLMQMVMGLDYSVGSYNSVTELDKKLTVDYWNTYDGIIYGFLGGKRKDLHDNFE